MAAKATGQVLAAVVLIAAGVRTFLYNFHPASVFLGGFGATSLTAATPLQATGVLLQSAGFVALVLLFWRRRSVPSARGVVEKVAS